MKIEFSSTLPAGTRLVAHVAGKDALPGGLETALVEGAKSARFKGRAGELFEGFAEREGAVVRVALAGAGEAGADSRIANLEKAGAALAAR